MHALKILLEKINLIQRKHHLLLRGDSVLVGVSGGPDSTALLILLSKIRHKYRLRLGAAYLNHGIYLSQSAKHQNFVKKLAKELDVDFYTKKMDIRQIARDSKCSLEDAGRTARYNFFEYLACRHAFNKIATAHTLDDQAETVLMRILRGAGLRGLAGIPPIRSTESGALLIRPLLAIIKKDILTFLKKSRQLYCLDQSNETDAFTRNKLRKYLLPMLERDFNPSIKQSLANLSQIFNAHQHVIEAKADRAFKRVMLPAVGKSNATKLRVKSLLLLSDEVLSEIFFKAYEHFRGQRTGIGFNHIQSLIEVSRAIEGNLSVSLPGGVSARKARGILEFIDTPGK